jgi:DNA-binding SARP family transcriptional activator
MNPSGTDQDRRLVVDLRMLDGFQLHIDDTTVRMVPATQKLLAFLALHEQPVTRNAVAAALWPDQSARRAAACLRSTLWRLVKPPHRIVEADADTLRVASVVRIDVVRVRRFAAGIARSADVVPDPSLVALLSADLLPGWDEAWVVAERDWFRQLRLRTLETLSERYRISGDHFCAHETAMAAVQGDPLRESAHRRLIELHLADGNPAEALRQYTTYRDLLRAELGLVPSPVIRRLVNSVLAGGQPPVAKAVGRRR